KPACDDTGEWEGLLECLESRLFWDSDYAMGHPFLDVDPDQARALMDSMGIDPDYYLALPPDPDDDELDDVRRTLREVTGRPEPQEPELVPALDNGYHGLLVGPCAPEDAAREGGLCPLVAEVGVPGAGPDDFDCSYEEWVRLFREEVVRAANLG